MIVKDRNSRPVGGSLRGTLKGEAARRYAALYYTNPKRTWSRWQRVLWWLILHAGTVRLYFARTDVNAPYLLRAKLLPRVWLHFGFRADDEMEQHNHPGDARSLILSEGYLEERGCRSVCYRRPGQWVKIQRDTFHRILSGGWFSLFFAARNWPEENGIWGFRDPLSGQYWEHDDYIALKRGKVPKASKAPDASGNWPRSRS